MKNTLNKLLIISVLASAATILGQQITTITNVTRTPIRMVVTKTQIIQRQEFVTAVDNRQFTNYVDKVINETSVTNQAGPQQIPGRGMRP